MMIFNYSFYAHGMMLGKDTASTTQTFQLEFPKVQVGIGRSYYSADISFAPASVWGFNATVSVGMQAGDMQFKNFSGIVYLHAEKVEWYNASMAYIATINILGYGVTIPGWLVNDVLTLLLGWTDAGIYVVVLYFLMIGGIGIGAGTGGGAVMWLIMKKMLKTGVSKGGGAAKGVVNRVKPGNR